MTQSRRLAEEKAEEKKEKDEMIQKMMGSLKEKNKDLVTRMPIFCTDGSD